MKLSDMSPRARWAQAQVTQFLLDHPEGLRQPLTLALQHLDDIGAILTPERAKEIAAEAVNEAADKAEDIGRDHFDKAETSEGNAAFHVAGEIRRMAADERDAQTAGAPPCSLPNDCDGYEPCDRHERESAHAEGEHNLCGDECAEGGEQ